MIFTGSEKRGNPKGIQPGNREWVTDIQGVNAKGWALPPFLSFSGKVLISSWFHDLPRDWVIQVSPNGWTSNELGLAWLKHFNTHTKARSVGAHRLLIVDGHESHNSHEFHKYCLEEKIIVLQMPAHSSHLLQPLDVGCFSPLKRAYGNEISGTEHQLFQVTERSISVDFSSKHDSNAFLNLFPNVLSPLQALWQARWPLLSFSSSLS